MTGKSEKPIKYEFGGPIGTFFTILSLPLVVCGLYLLCNDEFCLKNPFEFDFHQWYHQIVVPAASHLFSWTATMIYLGWMVFHVLLERILPGEVVEGPPLPDEKVFSCPIFGGSLFFFVSYCSFHSFLTLSGRLCFYCACLFRFGSSPSILAADVFLCAAPCFACT
jgi:hypothetical protein